VDGRHLLHATAIHAAAGEVTAVIGANGAGKSTLLRAVCGLVKANGRVLLDGDDLLALSPRQRAQRLALVAAEEEPDPALRVRAVVELGRYPHRPALAQPSRRDDEVVLGAMARTGVAELAERGFATLSDGERQRVRLARALAQTPAVLLLDEPDAHLDVKARAELAARLRALAADGLAVMAAVHDLAFAAAVADRVVALAGGRVLADGPADRVLTSALVERVYGLPCELVERPDGRGLLFAFPAVATAERPECGEL
jgi:iron complex transport system ATP-binding protein